MALGLRYGGFDFAANQVHIQWDIDFTGSTAAEVELKSYAADRYIPIPACFKIVPTDRLENVVPI